MVCRNCVCLLSSIDKIVRFKYINLYECQPIRAVLLPCEHVAIFGDLFVWSSNYWLEHRGVSYNFTMHRTTVGKEVTIVLRLRTVSSGIMRLYNERHSWGTSLKKIPFGTIISSSKVQDILEINSDYIVMVPNQNTWIQK